MVFSSLRNLVSLLRKNGNTTYQPNSTIKQNDSKALYQIFISLGPLILTVGAGTMMGFSGIFLPQLKEADSKIKNVDLEVESWIASSPILSQIFSTLLGGYLMEKIGRKWGHIISAIPGIIGWITISFSNDIPTILIGRFLTGIYTGILGPLISVYIGETTSPSLRPFLLGGIALSLTGGTLLCHLFGTFYSWESTALFCSLFPIVGGFLTLFSQETPTWLFDKKNIDVGCEAFKKIRGETEESMKELNAILEDYEKKRSVVQKSSMWFTLRALVTKPEIFKPLLIVTIYFITVQFAGVNVVTFYAISIVERSLGSEFENTYLIMLSMDSVRTVTSIVACILLRKLRRRQIAIIGGIASSLCLLILSVSSYISDIFPDSQILLYASLFALLGYVFTISISLVPLPWCVAGELLPQEIKGVASGALCFISFSAFFTVIKCAPSMFNYFGTCLTYFSFCCSALFGTGLCYLYLPETKNMTLHDIAETYKKGEDNKDKV